MPSESSMTSKKNSSNHGRKGSSKIIPAHSPQQLYDPNNNAFWFSGGYRAKLRAYALCDYPNNAYYDPADNTLCIGYDSYHPRVKFAQDPTIIYHEMGHVFAYVMLNLRNNVDPNVVLESDLGYLFYDEAGAIGEGLSDYFSFVMNKEPISENGHWAVFWNHPALSLRKIPSISMVCPKTGTPDYPIQPIFITIPINRVPKLKIFTTQDKSYLTI